MGGRGAYLSTNGFQDGKTLNEYYNYNNLEIDGIKVLKYYGHDYAKLPEFSNTSSAYISINNRNEMVRLRLYKNHFPYADIDLKHEHHWQLKKGSVHVHPFIIGDDGFPKRCEINSHPEAEIIIKKYAKTIRKMKESLK